MLGLTIIMVIKFRKNKQLFIWTPLFSVLTFFVLMQLNKLYPDTENSYTKDTYQFLEQSWYSETDTVFKRFKSDKPLQDYSDFKEVILTLDSIKK